MIYSDVCKCAVKEDLIELCRNYYMYYYTATTVVPVLVATLTRDHPLQCDQNFFLLLLMRFLLSLAKGHLSNMATIAWQIVWPY